MIRVRELCEGRERSKRVSNGRRERGHVKPHATQRPSSPAPLRPRRARRARDRPRAGDVALAANVLRDRASRPAGRTGRLGTGADRRPATHGIRGCDPRDGHGGHRDARAGGRPAPRAGPRPRRGRRERHGAAALHARGAGPDRRARRGANRRARCQQRGSAKRHANGAAPLTNALACNRARSRVCAASALPRGCRRV